MNTSRVSLSSRCQSNLIEDQIAATDTQGAPLFLKALARLPKGATGLACWLGQGFRDIPVPGMRCRRTVPHERQLPTFWALPKTHDLVEDSGIEPLTYWLQTSRSPS